MEITANAIQTVAAGANVIFTDTVVCGNCAIMHREGSGLVTLRGLTNQCRARFRVSFGGNIAITHQSHDNHPSQIYAQHRRHQHRPGRRRNKCVANGQSCQ